MSKSSTATASSTKKLHLGSRTKSTESNKTTDQEMKDLRAAFALLDKNSDGRVSPSELQSMLKTFGIHVPDKHIYRIVERASTGGTKGLTESEFLAWILPLLENDDDNPDCDLLAAFQVFDKDGNGFITRDELKRAMELMGEVLDDKELNQLIALADVDRDGRICYGEFARMLT